MEITWIITGAVFVIFCKSCNPLQKKLADWDFSSGYRSINSDEHIISNIAFNIDSHYHGSNEVRKCRLMYCVEKSLMEIR